MTFEYFLNNIILPVFVSIISFCSSMLNSLLSIFIFKIIIFISLIFVVIGVIKEIYYILFNKLNANQKDKGD